MNPNPHTLGYQALQEQIQTPDSNLAAMIDDLLRHAADPATAPIFWGGVECLVDVFQAIRTQAALQIPTGPDAPEAVRFFGYQKNAMLASLRTRDSASAIRIGGLCTLVQMFAGRVAFHTQASPTAQAPTAPQVLDVRIISLPERAAVQTVTRDDKDEIAYTVTTTRDAQTHPA